MTLNLDELERLEREATPGPWEWDDHDSLIAPNAPLPNEYCDTPRVIETDGGYYGPHGADKELIPTMRNALPELIALARDGLRWRGVVGLNELLEENVGTILSALELADRMRWRKCSEEMPEEEKDVIIFGPEDWRIGHRSGDIFYTHNGYDYEETGRITHWMPFPAEPKEEE